MQIAALSNLDLKLTLSEIQFDPFSYELISMSAVFILLVDSCVAMPGHRNSSTMRLIGFFQNNCRLVATKLPLVLLPHFSFKWFIFY